MQEVNNQIIYIYNNYCWQRREINNKHTATQGASLLRKEPLTHFPPRF